MLYNIYFIFSKTIQAIFYVLTSYSLEIIDVYCLTLSYSSKLGTKDSTLAKSKLPHQNNSNNSRNENQQRFLNALCRNTCNLQQ